MGGRQRVRSRGADRVGHFRVLLRRPLPREAGRGFRARPRSHRRTASIVAVDLVGSRRDDAVTDRTKELQAAIDSADYEHFTTLEEAAADELMRLWGDLHHQLRDARNGCWSVGCESVAHRIAVLTKALGKAARWQDMDIELLETGVYQRFHDLMGVPYEPPDMDVIAKMRAEREASLAELRAKPRAIPDLPDLQLPAG